MVQEQAITKVVRALKQQLEEYRQHKPHLSVRALAKRSHVNRYFIHKILDEDPEKITTLDFSQVLLLSKFLTNSQLLKESLEKGTEDIQNMLLTSLAAEMNVGEGAAKIERSHGPMGRLEFLSDIDWDDFDIFIILLLVSCPGTTVSLLKRVLCEKSIDKIEQLAKKGKLKLDGESVALVFPDAFVFPDQVVNKHLPEVIRRYFSLENLSKQQCFHRLHCQNVNAETLERIRQMHEDFANNLQAVLSSEESQGSIPIFTANCWDSFIKIED